MPGLVPTISGKSQFPRLAESYRKYQKGRNSELIKTRDGMKERIAEITTQMNKLIDIIVKSGSEVLVQKLTEIETDKIHLEAEYNQICEVHEIREITIDKLNESFHMARELLMTGELPATKKLIELYVDRVTVYNNQRNCLAISTHHFNEAGAHLTPRYNAINCEYDRKCEIFCN
jgi:hypothetical protein